LDETSSVITDVQMPGRRARRRRYRLAIAAYPPASEHLDQQNARIEFSTHEIDVVALVGKGSSLRNHGDIEFKTTRIARLQITERLK
jgi:hypothetical protein